MYDFAKSFKTLKAQTGKTNAIIARDMFRSVTAISNWSSGKSEPSLRDVVTLCEINTISVSTFIMWGES